MQEVLHALRCLEAKLDTLNLLAMKLYSEMLVHAQATTGTVADKADSFAARLRAGDPHAEAIAARRGIKLVGKEDTDNV